MGDDPEGEEQADAGVLVAERAPLPPQADNFHKQGQCPLWVQTV